MKLREYISGIKVLLKSFIGAMVVVNIVFLSNMLGSTLTMGDLIYMNGLCLLFIIGGIVCHYRQVAKAYRDIEIEIQEGNALKDELGENFRVLGIDLIRRVNRYKDKQFEKKEAAYKERLTNLTDYITQVIHDIKVNLAVCEMVSQRVGLEEKDKLNYEIGQMRFRVEQVLYVARANHYSEDFKAEYFEIKNIVKRAIKDNTEFFMNKGIELEVEVAPYEVLNDQKWVLYILTQILNNSSKYTKADGKVEITSREDAKAYYLDIKDNGIGIVEAELGRIFDKGFTGSNGRFNTKATGMGLYYAKQMADALNIGLGVESKQGSYTKFTLAFYKHSEYMNLQEELSNLQ